MKEVHHHFILFFRLHLSKKLPLRLSCFCMSLYLCKATIVLIEHFVFHPNKVPVYSYVTILFLVFMIIRIFVTEFDTNAHSVSVTVYCGLTNFCGWQLFVNMKSTKIIIQRITMNPKYLMLLETSTVNSKNKAMCIFFSKNCDRMCKQN